ncbi:MAG: hypothetical protein GX592_09890 [Clostridiales bacterium]|nr:hypothetical protein [Clostridiales bacterium]
MSDGLYEILALAARYFFAALFLLIVFRAWRITLKDGRRAKKLRRWAPETGLSGELMVVEGSERAQKGMRYPVIREGVLGSGRAADVRIRHSSIRNRHARFELTEEGLLITALEGAKLLSSDGARARKLLAKDGDGFWVGKVRLMLVLIDAAGREGEISADDGLFDAPPEEPPADGLDGLFGDTDDLDEDFYE